MRRIPRFHIEEDRMGNVIITHDKVKEDLFFQFQSDTDTIKELLTRNERASLEDGYTIDIKENTPRGSVLAEYFAKGE